MGKRGIKPRPAWERMHDKYQVNQETGCWEWTSSLNNRGYATISDGGRPSYAHRVAYEHCNGPIPDGMVVDHVCDVRRCVNPEHLQLLTSRQNIMRSSSPVIVRRWLNVCIRGHDLTDPANVYIRKDNGARQCKVCCHIRSRQHRRQAA